MSELQRGKYANEFDDVHPDILNRSPFSLNIRYYRRKYRDIVLIKTSQRTSGGLYTVNHHIRSADIYSNVGIIAYADLELNIR